MSVSRIGFGRAGGASTPSTTVGYQVIATGGMDNSIQRNNTESAEQLKTRSASAVLTYLGINITTNTISTAAEFRIRIATANGANLVSVTVSTTGWFEDSTHSDTLADGDLLDVSINCGTTTGTFTAHGGACALAATSNSDMYFILNGAAGGPPNSFGYSTVSTTWFLPIGGQANSQTANTMGETSETNQSKTTLRAAGTWSHLQLQVQTNAHAVTVRNRLNGANGAMSISTGFSTGLFEDTTHSDTVATGDACSYSITTDNVNSGTIRIGFFASKIGANDAKSDVISAAVTTSTSCTNAVTYYGPYGFYHTANSETSEANAQISCPYTTQFSNLRCACTTNSLGGALTYSFRNNGAPGNQSASIGAGSTGVFEDTTNTDSVTGSHKYCYSLSSPGGTTGLVVSWFASTQSGSQTYSSDGSDSFTFSDSGDAGADFLASGSDSFSFTDVGSETVVMDASGSDSFTFSDFSMDSFAPCATRIGFGRWDGGNSPSSVVGYIPITNNGMMSSLQSNYDEASVEITTFTNLGTIDHLGVNVTTNTVSTSPTITLRISGSDGTSQVTVPSSSTGWFEDGINSDGLVNGDGLDVSINCGTTVGTFTIKGGACTLTPNDTTSQAYYTIMGGTDPTPVVVFGPAEFTSWYIPLGAQSLSSFDSGENSETIASQVRLRSAGFYAHLQTLALTNFRISTTTISFRVNGADGVQSLSIPGGSTGYFSSLDTDNVLSLDNVNINVHTGAGTFLAFLDIAYIAVQFESYGPTVDLISSCLTSSTSLTASQTFYGPYGAYRSSNNVIVESEAQIYCPTAQIHTFLRCAVTQNSLLSTLSYTFRNNGVDGYMGCSLIASTTGVFEDTVNEDVVLAGTKYCYGLTGPGVSSGLVIPWLASTMMLAPTFDSLGADTLTFDDVGSYTYNPAVNIDLSNDEELILEIGELTVEVSLPPGPPILPAYPYQEYNDDDDILAFFGAYNDYAQSFSDWFQALHLPVYTFDPISGTLLDWAAKGLYGFDRPAISFSDQAFIGALNTFGCNILGYNTEVFIGEENLQLVTDDVFRRIITWHIQKSYGKVFNIRWLKRRIIQFLRGINGVVFNVDQTYDVSVTFGPGNQVNINFTTGTWTLIDGAFPNLAAPNGFACNAIDATFTPNTGIDGSLLKAAIQSGALELPFQFEYIVNL